MNDERNNLPFGEDEPDILPADVEETADTEDEEYDDEPATFADRFNDLMDSLDERTYTAYMEPDESTIIEPKKALTIVGITGAVLALLAFASFFFCGLFPYHTTGVTVDEFVKNFNSITSCSDIEAIIPDFENPTIPEDARINSRHPVSLWDGHIILDFQTRGNKIRSITAIPVDVPGYYEETHSFHPSIDDNNYMNYFAIIGKITAAMDMQIEYNEAVEDLKAEGKTSEIANITIPEITVLDASSYGYQLYDSAQRSYMEGREGIATLRTEKVYFRYNTVTNTFTVDMDQKHKVLAALPDGLQKIADWFKKDEKDTKPVVPAVTAAPAASASDASSADAQ